MDGAALQLGLIITTTIATTVTISGRVLAMAQPGHVVAGQLGALAQGVAVVAGIWLIIIFERRRHHQAIDLLTATDSDGGDNVCDLESHRA
jgi:hypothetical protein